MIKKRSLLKLTVLSVLTLGIYYPVFWYGFTKDINKACEEDGKKSPNFIKVLLMSLISCGLYGLFWIYRQGDRLYYVASDYGLDFKEKGSTVLMWTVLGSFLFGIGPFVSAYILIKNLNAVAEVYNEG